MIHPQYGKFDGKGARSDFLKCVVFCAQTSLKKEPKKPSLRKILSALGIEGFYVSA